MLECLENWRSPKNKGAVKQNQNEWFHFLVQLASDFCCACRITVLLSEHRHPLSAMVPGLRVPCTLEHLADYYELRILAGEAALEHGEAKTQAIFKRERGFVHYWKRKVESFITPSCTH